MGVRYQDIPVRAQEVGRSKLPHQSSGFGNDSQLVIKHGQLAGLGSFIRIASLPWR
jgi:hypothetical protein